MNLRSTILARGARAAAILSALAFSSIAAASASAQTPVVFGDTITDPGFYFLAGNQTGSGYGILIESDDVVLFLGRFTLRGDGTKAGIAIDLHDNVLIYGGRVTNFEIGASIVGCESVTIKDTRFDNNREDGVSLLRVTDSFFTRMRCDHNGGDGVGGLALFDCRFLSVLAHDNDEHGIYLGPPVIVVEGLGDETYSADNKIKRCWAAYNGRDGIRVFDADDTEIERNECVNNTSAGIRLGTVFSDMDTAGVGMTTPGSHGTFVRSNWCVFNEEGITVEWGSSGNTLTNNTALANFHRDLVEENYESPCVNLWFLNFFLTKGGAGAGCIF